MCLSTEILDKIVLLSQDFRIAKIAKILRNHISQYIYDILDSTESNILVYGQIQSGKTNAIINIINSPFYKNTIKVLVIQNSLLVLKQYQQRFIQNQLLLILLLLNNSFRYKYFKKLNIDKYILLLDESDQTINNCPLTAYKTYYEIKLYCFKFIFYLLFI